MESKRITKNEWEEYARYLKMEEKGEATQKKYLRDVGRFLLRQKRRGKKGIITKVDIIQYKEELLQSYSARSANTVLAAINNFLRFLGADAMRVKQYRIQRRTFYPQEKELSYGEYRKLLAAARKKGNRRLYMILQTLGATGARVSELKYFTVEAVRAGSVEIMNKGKDRKILLPGKLRSLLRKYIQQQKIQTGSVFRTRTGQAVDRTNIWREMKSICQAAGVSEKKVFPHNLRHMFARLFYSIDHDIASLSDILGHSNIDTTRIYVSATTAEHLRKMEQLRLII